MVRLPTSEDLGVRLPNASIRVPDIPTNPIPGAAQRAGNTMLNVAAKMQQEQEQADRFQQQSRYLQFEADWDKYLSEKQRSAPAGAAGFTSGIDAEYKKRAKDFFKDVPEHLKPEFDQKLVGLAGRVRQNADTFELKERDRYAKVQLDEGENALLERQRQQPDRWKDIEAEGVQFIQNSPLSEADKQARILEWKKKRKVAAYERMEAVDPKAAKKAILPEGGNRSLGALIRAGAAELGVDPVDLATAISYETGGKFSTSIKGGKGGRYLGLIQFGPEEQRKYGVHAGQSPQEQMRAVVRFLKDRGLKPGMKLEDIYSTINAGTPGRYNASDRPGYTVQRHVNEMRASAHRKRAAEMVGESPDDTAPLGDSESDIASIDPNFAGLDYETRMNLADGTQKRIDAAEKEAERVEREAAKETRLSLEREGYDLMLDNKLSPEWLEQHRGDIGISTYKTLARSLANEGQTWRTDPETYLNLLDQAESDPELALENAREAYVDKKIARDVFGTIRSRAERNIREEAAKPWSKDIRSFIRKSLDFGSFTTAAQKERQIAAGFAYDDWITSNPKASREEAMKQAKMIVEDYRRAKKAAAQTELPLPTNSAALPGNYTTNDLVADKETLKAKMQKGEITRDEAARQAKILMQWEKALTDVDTALPERKRPAESKPVDAQPAEPQSQSGPPLSERDEKAATAKEAERFERQRKSDEQFQNFMENQLGTIIDRLPVQ